MKRITNVVLATIIGITSLISVSTVNAKAAGIDKALNKYSDIIKKDEQEQGLKKKVSLIYLDNDSIPEMVISNDDSYDQAQPEVFTYHNGKVSSIFLADYAGGTCYAKDLKYVKKKGYLYLTSEHSDIAHIIIKLKSGKFREIKYDNR